MKTFREYINLIESAQHGEPLAEGVMDRLRRIYMGLVYDTPMGTPDSEFLSQWQREIKAQLGQDIDVDTLARLQQNFRERGQTMMARGDWADYDREMGITEQGVSEGSNDTVYPNAQVIKSRNGRPVGEIYQDSDGTWGAFHYRADRGADGMDSREDAVEELRFIHSETGRSGPDYTLKGVSEGSTPTYVLNVMDETTGEHWSIEVQASSPDLARQRAQQQGLKVLRVKEKGVAEGNQDLEETQQVEEDPVARITRLHRELNRR